MEPGGTGVPAPLCLKIGNYRFLSAFTIAVVAGQEAGHGLPATAVDFLVEHAAHLLSLAGASGISRHPWHREMQKRNLPPGQIPLLGMCLTEF